MKKFKPFANQADALTIGEFTVENGTDKVSLYGSLDITHDKAGLQKAMALKSLLDDLVQVLQQSKDMPENIPDQAAASPKPKQVKNPFA